MTPPKLWIRNVIESIKQIASAEFQEKGWVKGEIHEYCTFVETMCGLFDEGVFDDFIDNKAKEFGFTDDQIEKFDDLRLALNEYDAEHGCYEDPNDIIRDPEWLKIRRMAKDVLTSLGIVKYLDPSKSIFKETLLTRLYYISVFADEVPKDFSEQKNLIDRSQNAIRVIFENCNIDDILEHPGDYEILNDQHKALADFCQRIKSYSEKIKDPKSLEGMLDDPQWHEIQKMAQKIIEMFRFDPELLTTPENIYDPMQGN
jgi:hypothetical protein